jgi:hypothetical protein
MRHSVIKDHDLLVLTRDFPEAGLEAGDVGVVVAVYEGGGVEMEFVSADGVTLAVLTLTDAEVRPMTGAEILHVRGLAPV